MNQIKSFTLYREYYELITLLSDKEQQELLLAITKYMFDDIEPKLNDKEMKVFKNLKRPLDKSKTKSKATSKQNQNEIKIKSKQNQNEYQKENTSNDVNVNVNVNVKNNKFIKPTIEEIKKYCNERNNDINAESFYDFYESKDWYVGKNKMKDWKACVRTWEQRNNKTKDSVPEWFDKKIEIESNEDSKIELERMIKNYE